MRADIFPNPKTFDFPEWVSLGNYIYRSHDVVAFGTPLTVASVREAYHKGIFPWNTEGIPLPWHCPRWRAILEFDRLTIPRSLERSRRKAELNFTIDRDFPSVIRECALAHRPGQRGTWISPEFEEVFTELHHTGVAHSVETWNAAGELVGGLYGVDADGVFCGESMFFKTPNASKLALIFLIDHLRSRGSTWLDTQVITPHMQTLGAAEVPRGEFLDMLTRAQTQHLRLF